MICCVCLGALNQVHAQTPEVQQKMLDNLAAMKALIKPEKVTGTYEKQFEAIDKLLNDPADTYTKSISAIREMRRAVRPSTPDAAMLIGQLAAREYLSEVKLVTDYASRHMSLSWMHYRINDLNKLLPLQPQSADKLKVLIDAYLQMIQDARMKNVDDALHLARFEGWTLYDFHYPSAEKRKILEEKSIYEAKTHKEVNEGLKAYYHLQWEDTKRPAFEYLAGEYIKNPNDQALLAKLADALYAHLSTLDLKDLLKSKNTILPGIIWADEPKDYGRPDLGKETLARYDLAYQLNKHSGTYGMENQFKWDMVQEKLDQIIAVYPYHFPMTKRGFVSLVNGNSRDAFEYMAGSVAVLLYQRARTFNMNAGINEDWYYQGIPIVMALHDLANNQVSDKGLFPSVTLSEMVKACREKRWYSLAVHVAKSTKPYYATPTAESTLATFLTSNTGYKTLMLDALAEAHAKTSDQKERDETEKFAKTLGDVMHPYYELQRIGKLDTDDKKKTAFIGVLNQTAFNSPRHADLNFAYAMLLSKLGDKDQAMLHCNIAAGGLPTNQLKGNQLAAAQSRDALEGKDLDAIYKRYVALSQTINQNIQAKKSYILSNAQMDALITRLSSMSKLKYNAYLMRCDARTALKDYQGAIEDLQIVIKSGEHDKAGFLQTLVGLNQWRLFEHKQAITSFDAALNQPGVPNWLYYYRGMCYRQQQQYDKALADISKMIQLDPEDLYALNERSELYEYHFKQYANAKADLELYKTKLKKKQPSADMLMVDMRLYSLNHHLLFGDK